MLSVFLSTQLALGLVAVGGFLEPADAPIPRRVPTRAEITSIVPQRGSFTMPAPYGTQAIRITTDADCGGSDCVNYAGYSYWRNINNHRGQPVMLVFVGLRTSRGGAGPSLFAIDKSTGAVTPRGPLFAPGSAYLSRSGEGWYFSATRPTTLYMHDGTRLLRYDVETRRFETVFDIGTRYGSGTLVWQAHSSDDDRVHSASVNRSSGGTTGCVVYDEPRAEMRFFAASGQIDECQLDRGGQWLLIKDNVDGQYDVDNRIIDLSDGSQTLLYDQDGAPGHSDNGHGYMVGVDNWANDPGAIRLWSFDGLGDGTLVSIGTAWGVTTHVSHTNAVAGVDPALQYACSSHIGGQSVARANEIVCFRLDGSQEVLVVAPTLSDSAAAGGGDSYGKMPKANLDPTGEWLFWTSNMGGARLDAFAARVPWQLLVDSLPGGSGGGGAGGGGGGGGGGGTDDSAAPGGGSTDDGAPSGDADTAGDSGAASDGGGPLPGDLDQPANEPSQPRRGCGAVEPSALLFLQGLILWRRRSRTMAKRGRPAHH